MKLELKHLAPYLPYDLKMWYNKTVLILCQANKSGGIFLTNGDTNVCESFTLNEVKPILRPLLSMTKDEAVGFFKSIFKDGIKNKGMFDINNIEVISYDSESDSNILKIYLEDDEELIDVVYTIYINSNGSILVSECLDMDIYPPINISANSFLFLFKHHFDVFNLIENDLAIDKTKMK